MYFDLKNKKVTVIGAARSGIAAANAVLRLGGIAKVSESQAMAEPPAGVLIEQGGHTQKFIEDSDYVVLSPGVRLDALPVKWAREAGIEVMGEVEFAFRLCPCPIVAVTGSNGKTTTSTVIAEIIKRAGRGVRLCGNIGDPFSRHVLDLKPTDTVVLEISSFQLESTIRFRPLVAVWTNFSQNHLDRHKDLDEYFRAKCRIVANQGPRDFAVLNVQDPELKKLAPGLKARVLFFGEGQEGNPNYLAATQAARALGIGEDICLKTFSEFKGVEHRLEFVRHLGGVDFINDSKSTTVEAGRWALERALKPTVMICGGLDKHLDYSPLKPLVARKIKRMMAIGQAREIMKATFGDVVAVDTYASLEEAVRDARAAAQAGGCVLFSPMCASFDMFKDYEHRGRVFKEIVNGLK
ncbi:MAG: UDP-N-acetylmuramoyl-L-alanine--D-glutamate ligase [Candidatus Omnitrophica bacterium]|nr:UDP-N-acetylmuramoyl-L-alanine--D-glutamate ligase [Candidatus Omnitrophota bacterium]MDE2009818.1 UDP-N-acetylmuramoyl-L-alanine--D-glutamate ligase [Candidatus Omnitrophota bacterium]MDE2214945.1 UDP-N-acetylmuramoyl-L-alanine--D-glutamate ligase [Candidatus Omnitrophota bacterium]MDE2231517.1 UDP-N-acetylmuramoyl-L-alanine--D-glutamate ligase [Candidatus Omnitrophota bacterium]